ncbi:MAG: hypothetical protein ABL977_02950 [Candidatus Eisenbacteria bacterium]
MLGNQVYAGGDFFDGGETLINLIEVNGTSGSISASFGPDPDGPVHSLTIDGNRLFVGGEFTSIGGQLRERIAAIDLQSQTITAWNPGADGTVRALFVSDSTLFAGGSFSTFGGQPRPNVAAVNLISGAVTAWNPGLGSFGVVNALAALNGTVYIGGNFPIMGGQPRSSIAAVDTVTGAARAWNPGSDGVVDVLALGHDLLYVGGGFTTFAGQPRAHLAAVDVVSGVLSAWDPDVDVLGLEPGGVFALSVADGRVYAGGAFNGVHGLPQQNFASIVNSPEIVAIDPPQGGDTDFAHVTVVGAGFLPGVSVHLEHSGQSSLLGSVVVVQPGGRSLTSTFDLRGAALGLRDVVVTNTDGQSATLPNGYLVASGKPAQLRVDIVGPSLIRANYRVGFDIAIENAGNTDAVATVCWLSGIPAGVTIEPEFVLSPPAQSSGEPDWNLVPGHLTAVGGQYVSFILPRVPPGLTLRRFYLTAPFSVSTMELRAGVTPGWNEDHAALRACLADGGVPLALSCMTTQLNSSFVYIAAHPEFAAVNGAAVWAKEAWQCEQQTTLPAAVGKATAVLGALVQAMDQPGTSPASCDDVSGARWRQTHAVTVVGAVDPNEKFGAAGTVFEDQVLPYTVRFENLPASTANAQQVSVVDRLDPEAFDLRSFTIHSIRFGDRAVFPTAYLTRSETDVDLRPETNLIVRVSHSLDTFSGLLVVTLTSLDPELLQPIPRNTLTGFLPPNLNGSGEGSVQFKLRPRTDLLSGALLANRAALKFDLNDTLLTAVWLNTLDRGAPASQVLPLAAAQDSVEFTVRWEANGSPPDLRDFSVYVSDNGGPYQPWRQNTTATAARFRCQPEHQYAFYSVARDLGGNAELPPPSPDAVTLARLLAVDTAHPVELTLERPLSNPTRGPLDVRFSLPSADAATLELLDVTGRRILGSDVGAGGAGSHQVRLVPPHTVAPGLYWLRLRQGGQVRLARVVMLH